MIGSKSDKNQYIFAKLVIILKPGLFFLYALSSLSLWERLSISFIYSTIPLFMRVFTVAVTEVTPFGPISPWSYSPHSPLPPSSMHFRHSSLEPCDVFGKIIKQNCIWATDLLLWTRADVSGRHFPVARVQPKPCTTLSLGWAGKWTSSTAVRGWVESLGRSLSVSVCNTKNKV